MKQHPIQLDQEAERMAKVLAEKWGLPKQRFMSRVLLRCLERVYQQESGSEQPFAADVKGRDSISGCCFDNQKAISE